jgi:hypothetical protein
MDLQKAGKLGIKASKNYVSTLKRKYRKENLIKETKVTSHFSALWWL